MGRTLLQDSQNKKIENKPWYVVTHDTFLSGWGKASNKSNVLVFGCDSLEEAEVVAENAKNRSDQKNVRINSQKPHFDKQSYFVQYKDKSIYPKWYEKDAF